MNQFEMLNEVELMELDGGAVAVSVAWGIMEKVVYVTMSFFKGVGDGFQYAVDHNPLAF